MFLLTFRIFIRAAVSEPEPEDEEAMLTASITAYNSGRFSPKLLRQSDLEPGTVLVDPVEDDQSLVWARNRVTGTGGKPVETIMTVEEKVMQREAQKAMTK